jgi:molybdopterin biosynthesis enzyme
MDGFAVRAEDTYGASASSPISLRSRGEDGFVIGSASILKRAQAAFVVTGGQMPEGANAVVMVEYTKRMSDGTVEVSNGVHPA